LGSKRAETASAHRPYATAQPLRCRRSDRARACHAAPRQAALLDGSRRYVRHHDLACAIEFRGIETEGLPGSRANERGLCLGDHTRRPASRPRAQIWPKASASARRIGGRRRSAPGDISVRANEDCAPFTYAVGSHPSPLRIGDVFPNRTSICGRPCWLAAERQNAARGAAKARSHVRRIDRRDLTVLFSSQTCGARQRDEPKADIR
jgi:hypothetical protein